MSFDEEAEEPVDGRLRRDGTAEGIPCSFLDSRVFSSSLVGGRNIEDERQAKQAKNIRIS